ncbi:MAG: hypothetical protein F6J90_01730 [Moorea sp. SIOASIH]|uniref:hypothetical protein n=1 Tax=Moorena sp. SIOASIH TaxID=2607817 RepID=UPI0013B8505F|nr:hypothetical protein [Moorena sp. SIOASIH]NEO35089.1 hypothetical protein [Moorena sp. SIOASIH]
MGETTAVAGGTAVAHGGDHGSRSWGKPRQLLMGGTPKTALPPQDRAASPRPRCLPKTALPPQDRAASPRPRCIAYLKAES